jgi:positive phototaxis protein PixI
MFSKSANTLSLNIASNSSIESKSKQLHKFLQFQLGKSEKTHKSIVQGDIALLDAEIVTEVINISREDILPVPQMFYCVLGIYSWRSEMLWIVDLENLLGYPPPLNDNKTNQDVLVMVIQVQGQSIGLVISGIDNLIDRDLSKLKSSSAEIFSEDVLPFIDGYFTSAENDIIMLINAEEIFNFFSIKTEFNYSL